MLLAADVGGTKTDLAIFSVEGGPHAPLTQAQAQAPSADYPSLQALVTEFVEKAKTPRHPYTLLSQFNLVAAGGLT